MRLTRSFPKPWCKHASSILSDIPSIFVRSKIKSKSAADLKTVYSAKDADEAEARLGEFEEKWDDKYPSIGQSWRRNWSQVVPFFAFPKDVRRIIYTTNAIESLNASIRKIIKSRGQFPNDNAAIKLIYLAIQNAGHIADKSVWGWKTALNQFAIMFEEKNAKPDLKPMPDYPVTQNI